jgi:DNA-binding CsgD family transcriptional regulator
MDAPEVAFGATPDDMFVLLCDWHGRVVWGSTAFEKLHIGDLAWNYLAEESRDAAQEAVARVITLQEHRMLEIANDRGQHFRVWLWPLSRPDIALCVLAITIPAELARLTARERECLQLLGQGKSTRYIASRLAIGLTTVHTHLRRCREKLHLDSVEGLISFAGRHFCAPEAPPFQKSGGRKRK